MTWVAAGVTIASGLYTAVSQNNAAKQQELNMKADADQQESAARVEANKIREQAKKQRSAAAAQAADNGLDITTGSPVVIDQQIQNDALQDAWTVALSGQRDAARIRQDSRNVIRQGRAQAAGTLLQTAASAYSGYKGATRRVS